MNHRLATILPEITLPAAAGTYTIPIRVKEPISRIALKFNVTKSLNCMTNHPAADITKIELVDGSDVLHATSGFENQALCMFDRKQPSMNEGVHLINVPQDSMYGIDFGRFLFDPELAFLTDKFLMPQLKITYNSLISDTGATLPMLAVWAYVFDEKAINPRGFLMSKEHHNEACPANLAWKYVELPLDYPYRRIMLRAFLKAYPPEHSIRHVKIDEDNDHRIPFDINTEDYVELSMARWEQVNEPFHVCVVDATPAEYYFTPSNYFNTVAGVSTDIARHIASNLARTGGVVPLWATNTTTLLGSTMGYCPHHCLDFECGDVMNPDDFFDVTRVGDLRMSVQGGGAGIAGAYQVVIQQLRNYR